MRAGSDRATDLIDMLLHGFGVGIGHDDRHTGIAARTDGAEQIGVLIALILRLARARALLRPLVGKTVLLFDPHFVLEPHLNRGFRCELAHCLGDARGKVFFLNVGIACSSCAAAEH